jgi:nicotinamide-nucleotide amidase
MNAIILSIGDELTLGQTIDTNSAWLSQQLAAVGCGILAHTTVPDDQTLIERAIRDSTARCDFLIITGGIGPTEDDLTRQALAAVMGVDLQMNENWLHQLTAFFLARGRDMPESNKIQAMIPRTATMIENTCGTAAGIAAFLPLPPGEGRGEGVSPIGDSCRSENPILSQRESEKCRVFITPGVPKEMKAMFSRDLLPHIQSATAGAVILSRTLHTFGLGESWIAEKLGPLMNRNRNPSVGTTVSQGIVSLRINARFYSKELAQQKLDETTHACHSALDDLIFGADDESLASVVARMLLNPIQNPQSEIQNSLTITTAESCTGGLLAKMLTDIPGSSAYFKTGFITYSNEAKHDLLGVPTDLLDQHGAVSEPVVQTMAINARHRASADIALSISGIAGPTGGTPQKPVGTVCLALAASHSVLSPQSSSLCFSRTFNFPGDREMIRDRSAKMALTILRFHLLNKPLPF